MNLPLLLALTAFITVIAASAGKCPVWVPVLLLCILAIVNAIPLR